MTADPGFAADPPAPVLADGVPFVPGMPLWHYRFGRVESVKDHIRLGELRYYEGSGWSLDAFDLSFFFATPEAAARELAAILRDERDRKQARADALLAEVADLARRIAELEAAS